jgi:hypothetical protein
LLAAVEIAQEGILFGVEDRMGVDALGKSRGQAAFPNA